MDRGRIAAIVLMLVLAVPLAPAQDRGVGGTASAGPGSGGARVALVIGNSGYASAPLRNPANDAQAIADALQACGFDVTVKTDCDLETMEKAVAAFGERIRGADAALFYYAGHGIQVNGENYLVPVTAEPESEDEVKFRCTNVGLVLAKMKNSGASVNLLILDACRNNPFARSFRSAAQGLATMEAAKGVLIAYATAPGAVAADGTGNNSVYTASLLQHVREAGLPVEEVFKRVRTDVARLTNDAQIPWENTSLTGQFSFVSPTGASQPPRPQEPVAGKPKLNSKPVKYAVDEMLDSLLTATVDGLDYKIVEKSDALCLRIFNVRDYDEDGYDDALMEHVQGCGGNCCGNSYFFVSYAGNGHFRKSEEFGYSWVDPEEEVWNERWSVVVQSNNEGMNTDDATEIRERYVLESGVAKKVEVSNKSEVAAVKEIRSSVFEGAGPNATKELTYDLDSDGKDERVVCRFWERWGSLMYTILDDDGKVLAEDLPSAKRFGVLSTKTKGMQDIVIDFDDVYKWDGQKYAPISR